MSNVSSHTCLPSRLVGFECMILDECHSWKKNVNVVRDVSDEMIDAFAEKAPESCHCDGLGCCFSLLTAMKALSHQGHHSHDAKLSLWRDNFRVDVGFSFSHQVDATCISVHQIT